MTAVRGGITILSQIGRKELILAIWTAAHSDKLLLTFHFAGPCVRVAIGGLN